MTLLLSASRMNRHLGCKHASALWMAGVPDDEEDDPLLSLVRAKGYEHEAAVLALLEAEHGPAVRIAGNGRYDERQAATLAAMRDGATLIYQGALLTDRWIALPDFLVRRVGPDGGSVWSVEDAKLARHAKAGHAIQLAVYAELLVAAIGEAPHREGMLHVADGAPERLDLDGMRAATARMMAQFERFAAVPEPTRGKRCAACGQCGYRPRCEAEWRAADSLAFVAGIRTDQLLKLEAAGVATLALLAHGPQAVEGIGDHALAALAAAVESIRARSLLLETAAVHRNVPADNERLEVLSDLQWPIVGLARSGQQVGNRCRRHGLAGEKHEMREGGELGSCRAEDHVGLAGRRMVGHDALDDGFGHQLRSGDSHLVNEKVGAGPEPTTFSL